MLFLCTGNSARSQMAEGLVNDLLADVWCADSAGTEPTRYVHPLAMRAMAGVGVDISRQVSKPVASFIGVPFDLVVTVCNDAAESCPLWLGEGEVVHIAFPDPADVRGTEAERLEAFRRVRDEMVRRVISVLRDWTTTVSA